MNIAVCDDNPKIVGQIEKLLFAFFENDPNQFNYEAFLSGESLLDHLKKEADVFQIYLLDVEMEVLDGFEVARFIREKDQEAIIIFITSHVEWMPEAFEVNAFHYLIKPIDELKVKQVLTKAMEQLSLRKMILQFTIQKKVHTVYLGNVEYFESMKRKIILHLKNGDEHEYYGTMKEVIDKVSPQLFTQIHHSFVINMDYVQTKSGETIVMQSGREIAITKKFHKSFQSAYRNYVMMRTKI
ncbi:LytTR family DNA-binding domain-containing protein [Enterococcus raffinosus]|uniref:LytR/AlgR family response regulator transcription factor n=1 Tax=Enterococcus raffinosus TaxID=71452 RepID=UPI001C12250A|nr:LytTR family DNA-binding domain-containing protein [Enterococcus raffinosus]MBU5359643.1 LytTR family DNA-binding domain-containing protein [Enterococcus raffinosus]